MEKREKPSLTNEIKKTLTEKKNSALAPILCVTVSNEMMDSPKIIEEGSRCPNSWVIPSFALKLFFIVYMIHQFYAIGQIKGVTYQEKVY